MMNLIKAILVPTDFSMPADYAVHYAMKLAKLFDASIIFYHSFIPFESAFYPLAQSKKENKETENNLIKRLAKIKGELLKSNGNVLVSIHVDRGPGNIGLIEFCKKKIKLKHSLMICPSLFCILKEVIFQKQFYALP